MHDADKIVDAQLMDIIPWQRRDKSQRCKRPSRLEAHRVQYNDRTVDAPVISERQVLTIQKTTRVPRVQVIKEVAQAQQAMRSQTPLRPFRSQSLSTMSA